MALPLSTEENKNRAITSFIKPKFITPTKVRSCGRTILDLSLTCMPFRDIFGEDLYNLKKIHGLVMKYNVYNCRYEIKCESEKFDSGNPQLLDAIFSGCTLPCIDRSFSQYNPQSVEDIKTIVKLTPNSINCSLGTMRCAYFVTPLLAACVNQNIPVSITEFLLENGANPNKTILVNNNDWHMLKLLRELGNQFPADRYQALETLFEKHGSDPKMYR